MLDLTVNERDRSMYEWEAFDWRKKQRGNTWRRFGCCGAAECVWREERVLRGVGELVSAQKATIYWGNTNYFHSSSNSSFRPRQVLGPTIYFLFFLTSCSQIAIKHLFHKFKFSRFKYLFSFTLKFWVFKVIEQIKSLTVND